MDPIAGTDVERKKRKEIPGSDLGEVDLEGRKRFYTFRIQHIENILPTISEKVLYDILISTKERYEHIIKVIDSQIEALNKINEIKLKAQRQYDRTGRIDQELKEQFEMYRGMFFEPSPPSNTKIHERKTLNLEDKTIVESFLYRTPPLEELLPSITEQWLKDIILGIKERILAMKMGEKVRRDGYISFRKRNYMSEKDLSENVYQKRKNKKHVILIVDNEPRILNLTEKFLKLGNFETITSSNAKKAMEVVEGRYTDISLILLDVDFAGRSGMDVLRQIKAENRYKHILVVLFTLRSLDEYIQKAYALGADSYIVKPFSGKVLLKFLNFMINYSFRGDFLENLKKSESIELERKRDQFIWIIDRAIKTKKKKLEGKRKLKKLQKLWRKNYFEGTESFEEYLDTQKETILNLADYKNELVNAKELPEISNVWEKVKNLL